MNSFLKLSFLVSAIFVMSTLLATNSNLEFVMNKTQWDQKVKAKVNIQGGTLWLTNDQLLFSYINIDEVDHIRHMRDKCDYESINEQIINGHALFVSFLNKNTNSRIQLSNEVQAIYNYYIGNDKSKWSSNVKAFQKVNYQNIYDNIDLHIYSEEDNLKYDYIIRPGGNVSDVQQKYEGQNKIEIKNGNLNILTSINQIKELKPYAYQIVNKQKVEIPCNYTLNKDVVSFEIGTYDKSIDLIIDPVLIASVFSGINGSMIWGFTATYDEFGNMYSGGEAFGSGLPATPGAFQVTFGGGGLDMALNKFNPDATIKYYSTYIGGSGSEYPHSTIVDYDNNLVVMGGTSSTDFPTTTGCFQNTNASNGLSHDVAISKFNPDGTALIGSTYVGGSDEDCMNNTNDINYGDNHRGEVNVDINNAVYIVSQTSSSDFPVTTNSFQNTYAGAGDAVVFKMNETLTNMIWGTFLGGLENDAGFRISIKSDLSVIAVGGTGSSDFPVTPGVFQETFLGNINATNPWQLNTDGYVSHISSDGTQLLKSSFIGTDEYDQAYFCDLDFEENVYVMGQTEGNFPVTAGTFSEFDGGIFIAKLNDDWSAMDVSTTVVPGTSSYGSVSILVPTAFLVDVCDNIYVCGFGGPNYGYSVSSNAFMSNQEDFYFMVLNENAQNMIYASYFGGDNSEHVDGGTSRFDKRGIIYQGMCTNSASMPGSTGTAEPQSFSSWDICVFKFDFEQVGLAALANAEPSTNGCAPFTVQFNNLGFGGLNYFWDFGDGVGTSTDTLPEYTYTDYGVYEVTLIAEDPSSCLITDTSYTTITVSNGQVEAAFSYGSFGDCDDFGVTFTNQTLFASDFYWDFGDGFGTSTDENPIYTYSSDGTYDVTLIGSDPTGCNFSDTVIIPISLSNDIDPTQPDFAYVELSDCSGMEVTFDNTSLNANEYIWDFGDGIGTSTEANPTYFYTTPGTYDVTLSSSDINGCFSPSSISYQVTYSFTPGAITALFTVSESSDCSGLTISINNTTLDADTYFWDFGDGYGTSILQNPTYVYANPGTYTISLIASDSNACFYDGNESQTVIQPEPIDVEAAVPDYSVCLEETINFSVEDNASAQATYEWDFGDGNESNDRTPSHAYNAIGNFIVTLTVTDLNPCSVSVQVISNVAIVNDINANFTITHTLLDLNEVVPIVSNNDTTIYRYWNFGDGTLYENPPQIPEHRYDAVGEYDICLEVSNELGCANEVCKRVEIENRAVIYIPTAFSPNGDGENEIFKTFAPFDNVEEFYLAVYSRWGQLMFDTHDYYEPWDGNFNNEEQDLNVFVWYYVATFTNGVTVSEKGNVTLIR